MTTIETTAKNEPAPKQPPRHNPDEWVIFAINFLSKMGSPITGASSWSALGSSQQDRYTTVLESPHHITLVYEAGPDVRQRWDIAKINVDICRIPVAKLEKMRAAIPGGR